MNNGRPPIFEQKCPVADKGQQTRDTRKSRWKARLKLIWCNVTQLFWNKRPVTTVNFAHRDLRDFHVCFEDIQLCEVNHEVIIEWLSPIDNYEMLKNIRSNFLDFKILFKWKYYVFFITFEFKDSQENPFHPETASFHKSTKHQIA